MPHASSDVSSNDEVKVYRVEGEVDDESSAENLKEEKRSLVTEVALKEESRSVDGTDRSIPNSEPPHHSNGHHQPHVGAFPSGKPFDYFPSPAFGYVPGYHPHARSPYGALPMVSY
ncbi:hypothetical protein JTE90_020393 [Oedothorax gibbosus]|uniref:Uncharacterized protein n=1 Tax=Oedothorax gibbosus TaxID=931172 RepID=A0AAV6UEQ4_9ARAC|nr:hypothetical protein JTE90_020393 [Oedothorax gibbosus]